jgi:hypothetical protein
MLQRQFQIHYARIPSFLLLWFLISLQELQLALLSAAIRAATKAPTKRQFPEKALPSVEALGGL